VVHQMNVLVIVDGGLVETLQASALIRSMVTGLDDVQVTVACPPAAAALAAQVPGVVETLAMKALEPGGASLDSLWRGWLALRRRRFHAAAVCADGGVAAALVFFAGIPRRAGVASGVATLLLTDHVDREGTENRAALWLRLASVLGVGGAVQRPAFNPGLAARRVAEERLLASGFEDVRATAWEPERFAHLCNELTRRHGAGIVVLGAAEDRFLVEAMLMDVESEALDLSGELGDLGEAAAVLERCDLVVCGDSPLLHLAAAVGTASVGLFGPTSGAVRAPLGSEHRVIQALDGGAPSLRQIRVDDVLAGIETPLTV
jgi:heptosyltransferase-2